MNTVLGKRERPPYSKHFYPSGPGAMPPVSNRPAGPSVPPTRSLGPQLGVNIPVQSRSTVKYLETNPTGSIPLMIRPWQDLYEKDYAPGCLIFCKQDKSGRSPLITCADVPTMNYLLAQGHNGDPTEKKVMFDDYEFFGVFRNDAGKQVDHMGFPMYTNVKQRLIQCDVYGRAKVANFWGRKLRTGDSLEIALIFKNIAQIKKPNRAGIAMPRTPRLQLVPLINGCTPGTNVKPPDLDYAPLPGGNKKNVLSYMKDNGGFIEQMLNVPAIRAACLDRVLKKWRIGVVSQSAFEPPSDTNITLAMHSSQQRTHLPQVEILMI